MTLLGHVQNGAIVTDTPFSLPEGTPVRIEVLIEETPLNSVATRRSGLYAGQIWMALDFDAWPKDIEESLGVTSANVSTPVD